MVANDQRHVLRARLRCARPEEARHGGVLLADALRTASLPDRGRLVVFRRVDLGRLSLHGSPTAWSRRLERELQALADHAVPFAEPAAAHAPTVWFADDWQPAMELAVRLVRGAEPSGWFWAAAVPGWRADLAKTAAASRLFRHLTTRGGVPATLALARRLHRAGGLFEFAEWLPETDLAEWVATRPVAAGSPEPGPSPTTPANLPPIPSLWREQGASFAARVGHDSPRLIWAMAGWLSVLGRAPAEPALLRELATGWAAQVRSGAAVGRAATAARPAVAPPTAGAAARIPAPSRTAGAVEAPAVLVPGAPSEAGPRGQTRPTVAGGMLFTLGLLRRLGWPAWLGEQAGARAGPVTLRLWRMLADRFQIPNHDALREWLDETHDPAAPVALPFYAPRLAELAGRRFGTGATLVQMAEPGGWRLLLDGSGRLPLGTWPRTQRWVQRPFGAVGRGPQPWPRDRDPLLAALSLGAHRLCRRVTGLGLRPLVTRPARLA